MDKVHDDKMKLDIISEEEKFRDILFLCRADDTLYGNPLDQLKYGSQLERDQCTLPFSRTYNLLVRHSCQIDHNRRRKGGQMGDTYQTNVMLT